MNIIWKTIDKHPNYMISSNGKVKHLSHQIWNGKGYYTSKERILKGFKTAKGYISVEIESKTYPIHRLVAKSFIDNSFNKPQINHKNGIKEDNNVDNLEWVTNDENMKHAYQTGLQYNHFGIKARHHTYLYQCNEYLEWGLLSSHDMAIKINNLYPQYKFKYQKNNMRTRLKCHNLTFERFNTKVGE